MTPQATAEMPAARPSRPSLRLMALVMPTIHRSVSGQENQPKSSVSQSATAIDFIRMPTAQTAIAAAICARNFMRARRPLVLMSSISPTKNIHAAAESSTITLSRIVRKASPITFDRNSTQTVRGIIERNIAVPPMCDMGFVCTWRAPGTSAILRRRASHIITGVITNARKREPRYTDR
ncbi:hypothetical protein ES703_118460 [subsurface metagenome]